MSALIDLYREQVRRHAANPVGYRRPIRATHRHELDNPQCGDRVEMQFELVEGTIRAAAFDGQACAICLASASLLCELAPGLRVDALDGLHRGLAEALSGPSEGPALGGRFADDGEASSGRNANPQGLGPLEPLLGVRPYPSRVGCALLPWRAARHALQSPDVS